MTQSGIRYTLHEFGTPGEGRTHLVYGIDEHFIRGAAACLASATHNSINGICAHIIFGQKDVTRNVSDVLSALVARFDQLQIRLYAIEDFATDLIVTESLTSAMYYRYSIGELLHGHTDRAIYLDADIIVDCNLDDLYGRDMSGYPLSAVEDRVPEGDVSHVDRMKAFFRGRYFNSGMLLIDVAGWKQEHVFERAVAKTLEIGQHLKFYDQDVLNILFADRWQVVEDRWNFTGYRETPCRNVVAHYIGCTKPWMAWCDPDVVRLYDTYEAMTPFAGRAKLMPDDSAKEAKHYKRHLWRSKRFFNALAWEIFYVIRKRRAESN